MESQGQKPFESLLQGEEKRVPVPLPPLFFKKAMQWGKKWPVQVSLPFFAVEEVSLPFFAVEAYVPGGVQNQAEKKIEKCLPAGAGTKIYFSSVKALQFQKNPRVRKMFVGNSGAENGCANFMDAWKNASALQEKPCP